MLTSAALCAELVELAEERPGIERATYRDAGHWAAVSPLLAGPPSFSTCSVKARREGDDEVHKLSRAELAAKGFQPLLPCAVAMNRQRTRT